MPSVKQNKLYAIKKSKTGRNSVVQVSTVKGKGKVYTSTGRKIGASTKTFKTKASAQKHLKSSSFGRKRKSTKKKGEFIACVNPELEEGNPKTYFKVFPVITHTVGPDNEKIKVFHTGSNTDYERQYWRIPEDSDIRIRTSKKDAEKDAIAYGQLADAGVTEGLIPENCTEGWPGKLPGRDGDDSFHGSGIRMKGLMGALLTKNENGKMRLPSHPAMQTRMAQLPKGEERLRSIFGLDPNVLGMSKELKESIMKQYPSLKGKSNKYIERQFLGRLGPRTFAGEPRGNVAGGEDFSPSVKSVMDTMAKPTSFGRYGFGSSIPTFGRYAYPVDPQFKKLIDGRGSGFGRINYGFSRYF